MCLRADVRPLKLALQATLDVPSPFMPHSGFLGLRSLLFNVGWYVGSTVIAIVGMPLLLAPRRWVVAWSHFWIRFCLGWLRITCLLTHRLAGLGNMPSGPVIIAAKHQSTWETLAFALLFPNAAIILKRELLFIPVVGWPRAVPSSFTPRARGRRSAPSRPIRSVPRRSTVSSACRSCRWRSIRASSGVGGNSSNGPVSSMSKCCRPSRPGSTGKPSWQRCGCASRRRRSGWYSRLRNRTKKEQSVDIYRPDA